MGRWLRPRKCGDNGVTEIRPYQGVAEKEGAALAAPVRMGQARVRRAAIWLLAIS
jgi:hypothetical protein